MFENKVRLWSVIILCLCGIGLSIGLVVWIFNHKNSRGYDGYNSGTSKYISWANTVSVDPNTLYPVTDVIDGDTIKVLIEGHIITVRLLGINTPETVDPYKPVECFGPEASNEVKKILTGKSVFLTLNANYERVDKYGRLLAYVKLVQKPDGVSTTTSDLFVNEFLIKEGYAHEYTFNEKNPYQYQGLFKADELEAKKAGKGLWGKCPII